MVGYSKRHDPLVPSASKGNSKFEILLVQIFNLKQKAKSNILSYYRKKPNFYSSRKQSMVPLDKVLPCVNVKQKIWLHKAFPAIIQAYSSIFRTLSDPGIFRTVAYPEP